MTIKNTRNGDRRLKHTATTSSTSELQDRASDDESSSFHNGSHKQSNVEASRLGTDIYPVLPGESSLEFETFQDAKQYSTEERLPPSRQSMIQHGAGKGEPGPSMFKRLRDLSGKVVNDERVQLLVVALIIINAIMMGLATFDFISDNDKRRTAFERTDKAFLILFTIESFMQLVNHGIYLFTDAWLFFDFAIIIISWSMASLQVIRAFRIFRAFRLITRLDVLKNLVMALFAVAPSVGAIISLLTLVMYIYAVLCTILFKDLYERGVTEANYFSRLDYSFFTLFQMITLDWAEPSREVMGEYDWAWIIFVSFIVVTSFILYSLIIAVVCDAVSETEHSNSEKLLEIEQASLTARLLTLEMTLDERLQHQRATLLAIQAALCKFDNGDNSSQGTGVQSSKATWLQRLFAKDEQSAKPSWQRHHDSVILESDEDAFMDSHPSERTS